jgi:hypothetical protein
MRSDPARQQVSHGWMIASVALAVTASAVAVVASAFPAGAARSRSDDAGLRAVRAFTERYQSEAAALADGFAPTDECVPEMGYHYVNFARLDDRLEPNRPEVIIYAPTGDSARRLAAAEWVVVDADQDLSTDDDRPSLFGHSFDGPMPGHVPGMPVHYDLHAYAWIDNPDGGFATSNPAITCP